MKTKIALTLTLSLLAILCLGQEQFFTAAGSKQGKISVVTGKIENNQFKLVLKVQWLDKKLNVINDTESQIVFDKTKVLIPGNEKIQCRNFSEDKTNTYFFNSALSLHFEIDEDLILDKNDLNLYIPFHYAANAIDAVNPEKWVKFLSQSPRNYVSKLMIEPSDIKDLTDPTITVLAPEGVMEGFRPMIYSKDLEVVVSAVDKNGVKAVTINSIPATRTSNGDYVTNVQFTRIGGTYPIKVLAVDIYGNEKNLEFYVETKQEEEISQQLMAQKTVSQMIADVDTLIPIQTMVYEHRYALIIGNEDYKSHQKGLNYESNVEFARRDAEVFKQYAIKTMGIPEAKIIFLTDAKAVEMHRGIGQLNALIKKEKGNAEVVVFFAGHGFPDEKTKEGYLIPVDVSGNDLEFAVKLKDFYAKLYEHPSKSVTVFLDACFSGGGREQGLVAARAVRVRAKEEAVRGNLVVFSASAGNETALPLKERFHGIFTYYLLKALQESEGKMTMGELVEYVTKKVAVSSIIYNNKEQNPQVNTNSQLGEAWKEWKFN